MLSTPFYKGQGLGNQLANYLAVRCMAYENGYDFGVLYTENFKGASFINLDMGMPVTGGLIEKEGFAPTTLPDGFDHYYREKTELTPDNVDISDYDFTVPKDNTLIHGLYQGVKYFKKYFEHIDNLLKVETLDMPDNLCVINVRGGEYKYVPSFILPKSYWEAGVAKMLERNPKMKFEVHTDDPQYAMSLFPNYPVYSEIGLNWRSIRYAKNLLLSNSSFAIIPAYLNRKAYVIAPMYFAGHNIGQWALKQNKVSSWNYIL